MSNERQSPSTFHPAALAKLDRHSGTVEVDTLLKALNDSDYRQSDEDKRLWMFLVDDNGGDLVPALYFSPDYNQVGILTRDTDNTDSLAFVLRKGGWNSAELSSMDSGIERQVVKVFTAVKIVQMHKFYDDLGDEEGIEFTTSPAEVAPLPVLPDEPESESVEYAPPPPAARPVPTSELTPGHTGTSNAPARVTPPPAVTAPPPAPRQTAHRAQTAQNEEVLVLLENTVGKMLLGAIESANGDVLGQLRRAGFEARVSIVNAQG